MDYDFLGKTLAFARVNGDLLFTDDRAAGAERGGATPGRRGKNRSRHLARERRLELQRQHHCRQGRLPEADEALLRLRYRARRALRHIRLQNARRRCARRWKAPANCASPTATVFAIPVFGPLSSLMSAIIPGSGHSVQREASASFTGPRWRHQHEGLQSLGSIVRPARPRRSPLPGRSPRLQHSRRSEERPRRAAHARFTSSSNTKATARSRSRTGIRRDFRRPRRKVADTPRRQSVMSTEVETSLT